MSRNVTFRPLAGALLWSSFFFGSAVPPVQAWWPNGHELIARGAQQNLVGTGDLQRFLVETNDQFVKIPQIEPAPTHFIDVDTTVTTTGNAGVVSYANDFAKFRTGTFNFPTSTAAATARYGNKYLSDWGAVPWLANDALASLTSMMQAAATYDDWYRLLPTAGALAHYIQDMHQPMHLTKDHQGIPPSDLHGNYEGGQLEEGSISRYPELFAAITPVAPTNYGSGTGFINAIFNRIPTDYDKNVAINKANVLANAAGSGSVYYDTLWNETKVFTKDSFQDAAATMASALYTAYINSGSRPIPAASYYVTPAKENSTITATGPVSNFRNTNFCRINGSGRDPSYGVVRFDLSKIKSQYDARYGAGMWTIDNVALATEVDDPGSGTLKVFYSPDDTTNIQSGSILRYADGGSPLGLNFAIDTPVLQFLASAGPTYSITRFDTNTTAALNWAPFREDILDGDIVTLVITAGTSNSSASYFGGAGLSLEVSAHAVPEPGLLVILMLAAAFCCLRRGWPHEKRH